MSVSPKYNHHSPELSRTHTQRRKQTNVKGKKKYSTKYLNTLFIRRPNKRHLNYLTIIYWGSKGWRSGESARLPKMWPSSNPGVDAISGLSLLLVLFFAPRSSSPGTPVFPSPQNPTLPNSNSTRNQVDEEPLCGCATSKSLFIDIYYLFTYILQRTVCKRGSPSTFLPITTSFCPIIWSTAERSPTIPVGEKEGGFQLKNCNETRRLPPGSFS